MFTASLVSVTARVFMDVRTMQGRGAASGLGDLCTYGVQYFVLVIIVRDIDTWSNTPVRPYLTCVCFNG